jgi:uncharacterized protein YidB (DUF937 family)
MAGGPRGFGFGFPGGRGGGGDELETAAKALGMNADDLRTALEGGKTIAQVAKDKGVDVSKVIDALVADAKARITDLVNNGRPAMGGHDMGADAAAKVLGITPAQLRTALQGGKTIAQVAKDKGVDVSKVIAALVAEGTTRIDQAQAAGRLSATEATDAKQHLTQVVTDIVHGTRPPGGGPFGPDGPHHR